MLILRGTLRAAMTLPGRTDKKSGEIYKPRDVLQVETLDARGLVQMSTITVPDLGTYPAKIGEVVNLPVRAWAQNAVVNFMFENVQVAG
jgi:hypothetical protein